jgi:hypothetical protein
MNDLVYELIEQKLNFNMEKVVPKYLDYRNGMGQRHEKTAQW